MLPSLICPARPKVAPYLPDMPLLHYLGTQQRSGSKTAGSGDSRCSELPEGRSHDSGPDGPRCRLSSSCCLASGRALVGPGPRAKSAPPRPPPGGRPCVGSQWRDGHPLYCDDSPRRQPLAHPPHRGLQAPPHHHPPPGLRAPPHPCAAQLSCWDKMESLEASTPPAHPRHPTHFGEVPSLSSPGNRGWGQRPRLAGVLRRKQRERLKPETPRGQ